MALRKTHPDLSLRARLSLLLPPAASGVSALSDLAGALKAFQRDGQTDERGAVELLAESWMAAWPVLVRHARVRVRALSAEQAEDVVCALGADLAGLYRRWTGKAAFSTFVDTALLYRGLAELRGTPLWADDAELPSLEANEELSEGLDASVQVRALRRLAWYLYGSPDNPRRLRYSKAEADFQALAARLEGRPYAELVRHNQPRPGRWDEGQGETDRKWWRGRASSASTRLKQALASPETRAWLDQVAAQLTEERS